jgi:hypothetical protein
MAWIVRMFTMASSGFFLISGWRRLVMPLAGQKQTLAADKSGCQTQKSQRIALASTDTFIDHL